MSLVCAFQNKSFNDSTALNSLYSWQHFMIYRFLLRPSTVSTRSVCTVSHSSQPTPSQRRPLEAYTSVKPSRTFWRETCTPVTSSCAHTPVLPTYPSHARNSQVHHLSTAEEEIVEILYVIIWFVPLVSSLWFVFWFVQWMSVLLLCWSATWWQGNASPRLQAESWVWWRTRIWSERYRLPHRPWTTHWPDSPYCEFTVNCYCISKVIKQSIHNSDINT